MKLWVDDLRPKPLEYDFVAKDGATAISLLETGRITEISLDHDLGDGGDGYTIAKWIETEARIGRLNPIFWKIHSMNPVGTQNMRMALEKADEYWGL
jgi:hypothetical protein